MSDSIFTKIIKREIPAEIVWENDEFIAILDIHPQVKGHTLLIPKIQVDKFYDVDEQTYTKLFNYAKEFAKVIEKTFSADRTGLVIEGFGVPHTHLHIIPFYKGKTNLDPNLHYDATKEELTEVGKILSERLSIIK